MPKHETNGTHHATDHGLLLQRACQYTAKAEAAIEGERNGATFNLAGNLAGFTTNNGDRLSEAEIVEVIRPWNLRNSPPLEDSELRQCVQSALVNGTPRTDKVVESKSKPNNAADEPPLKQFAKYTFGELAAKFPTLNKPVLHGWFREGETVNIIAAPKVGKSWFAYLLALTIVSGGRLFDMFNTSKGRVLLIDNELHGSTLAMRIPKVAEALELFPADYADQLDIWPLRGNLRSLKRLAEEFEALEHGYYKAIILDAKYRFGNGESENDNAAETQLYNTLDQIAEKTGAAVVLIHHSSKGNQSGKTVTDVGAGAGAQSRAADCHIVLREHEDDGVVVLDAAVRSFPPVEPVALKWSFPLWEVTGADTTALKGRKTASQQGQIERDKEGCDSILASFKDGPATMREIRERTAISKERAERLVDKLHLEGHLKRENIIRKGNECYQYQLAKTA